jgi:quinol monooxygenase YgiN
MIHVLATVELQPGTREKFLAELLQIVPKVRAEQGCVEYTPTIDAETSLPVQGDRRENVVVIVERWETLQHLEAHLVAPHMMEYRPKVREFIQRVGLQLLQPVAGVE